MTEAIVWNALAEDGRVKLFTRSGEFEVDWADKFYVREADAPKFPKDWSRQVGPPDRGYCPVFWPERVRNNRDGRLKHFRDAVFEPRGITPLEADVDPVQRLLAERPGLTLATDWRVFLFDLETETIRDWSRPWEQRILGFSWRSLATGQKGHVRLEALTDAAERVLLNVFLRLAGRHDVLVSWSGSRFDDRMVRGRCIALSVPFDADCYHWLDHLRVFKKYWLKQEDGAVTSSYALDAIAEALLGEHKIDVEGEARAAGWTGDRDLFLWVWKNRPDLFKRYNDRDVELMEKIEERTEFLRLHFALCRLCRVFPTAWSVYALTQIDGRMLQVGHERGYHFPTRYRSDDDEEKERQPKAKGAFIPDAAVGVHSGVCLLDYSRMYPSIIRTWNMSPETLSAAGELEAPETDARGVLTGKTIARFLRAPVGHVPHAIGVLIEQRREYDARRKLAEVGSPEFYDLDRLSNATKVLTNAFYGALLSLWSRFYNKAIGESITAIARHLLVQTIKLVEGHGHRLIFGDTDSVAFVGAHEEATELKRVLNEDLIPALVTERGGVPGEVSADYEKRFKRLLVTASKRYAGTFDLYKGKPAAPDAPPHVRGLEIVRSDVCRAARNLQRTVVGFVLEGQDAGGVAKFVEETRHNFLSGSAELRELVVAKGLSKSLSEYSKTTTSPQVRVAAWMAGQGRAVDAGTKIPYLLTLSGPVHPEGVDLASIDLATYWNKHVFPPTYRVLKAAFGAVDWDAYFSPDSVAVPEGQDALGLQMACYVPPLGSAPPKKTAKRVRPVAQPTLFAGPGAVRLVLGASFDRPTARKLRALLEAFTGSCALELVVCLPEDGVEVDLLAPQKVRSPAEDGRFAAALRGLGLDWGDAR